MKITIKKGLTQTEVQMEDAVLQCVPCENVTGGQGAALCVKNGSLFGVADVNCGNDGSSDALCAEIARRWNTYPKNMITKFPLFEMDFFYMHQFCSGTGVQYVLIRKDGLCSIDFYVSGYTYIGHINIPHSMEIPDKDAAKLLRQMVIMYCIRELKQKKFHIMAGSVQEQALYKELGFEPLDSCKDATLVHMMRDDDKPSWC